MRKRLINMIVICLAILFLVSLAGCINIAGKVSTEKTFEETIEEKLKNITNPEDSKVSLSSNPHDYIKDVDSSEDYKYIISQRDKALKFMLNKFANSNKNGLEEYIMAMACSEILKENPSSKNWSSGRAWYENYIKVNKQN